MLWRLPLAYATCASCASCGTDVEVPDDLLGPGETAASIVVLCADCLREDTEARAAMARTGDDAHDVALCDACQGTGMGRVRSDAPCGTCHGSGVLADSGWDYDDDMGDR